MATSPVPSPSPLSHPTPNAPLPRPPALQGKRSKWRIAFWLLFWLFVLCTGAGAFFNLEDINNPNRSYLAFEASASFALDLWAFIFALFLGLVVVPNRLRWRNGTRFAWGFFALGVMLGRIACFGLLGYLLISLQIPLTAWLTIAPVILELAGIVFIVGVGTFVLGAFTFFVGVPVAIFNQIFEFEHALAVYRYKASGLAAYIVRFVLWLRNERPAASPPDESKGARYATFDEIDAVWESGGDNAMAFGGWLNGDLRIKNDKHVLVMASTRSGKGVALIIPHLLRYKGSAFVLDPKGENARATGRQRAALNDHVHYLDPFGISGKPKSRFNPLSRFTPENMEAESKALAAAMFVVSDRQRDHWTDSAQQLVALVIMYVYVSPKVPAAHKDLPQVRRIVLSRLNHAFSEMLEMKDADGLLSELAMSFRNTPEKELGSIVSTAQRQTEILDNPYMIACLSADGEGEQVDFKAWHTGTMTVFLCLSAPKFPTFNRWLRLVLTSALDEMTDKLDPPPLPVCFMLDELATLGHLAPVENAVGLAAGYGIQLVYVFQDTAQMRDLYKGRWASFVGNAGVRVVFNLDDFDTAEYWSKFIGGRLVETRSSQQDIYGYSKGDNVGEAMRPLMSPEKIMFEFASKRMLVLAQGLHPILTIRLAYWDIPHFDGLWDDPRPEGARSSSSGPSVFFDWEKDDMGLFRKDWDR